MCRVIACAAVVAAVGLAAPVPALAQQPTAAQVDSIFAEWDRDDSPGCTLGVVRDGGLVYQRGYGSANLDYGIPNSPQMVYYVGSLSKQFTAAAIALLVHDGRISLDDDVRMYIPELPDYGSRVTVRHLVHHSSGIPDIYGLMSRAGARLEDVFTDEQALALIAQQRSLEFVPGERYAYSNSGYWLLGRIVQRVSGQTLREFADARIFGPLGMSETHFHDEPHHPFRNRVISYGRSGAAFRITYLHNFDKTGAGGLYTTIADLARWDANFQEPRVGGDALLRTLHERGVLASGDTLPYAFGLVLGERRGLDVVGHSGALMGFRADFTRYPSARLSVITLCNLGDIDAPALGQRVADMYLGPPSPSGPGAGTDQEARR
jgi:CubicO group peptidase (beta-lactamase class C family)